MNKAVTAKILHRSFWLGILLLAYWANVFRVWDIELYASHAPWFGLNYHEFVLFQYGGMILFALGILVFFLIPLLAIKWTEHSEKHGD